MGSCRPFVNLKVEAVKCDELTVSSYELVVNYRSAQLRMYTMLPNTI